MTAPDELYESIAHAALKRCTSERAARRILAGFELELRYTPESNAKAKAGLGYVIAELKDKIAKAWPGFKALDTDPERYP